MKYICMKRHNMLTVKISSMLNDITRMTLCDKSWNLQYDIYNNMRVTYNSNITLKIIICFKSKYAEIYEI